MLGHVPAQPAQPHGAAGLVPADHRGEPEPAHLAGVGPDDAELVIELLPLGEVEQEIVELLPVVGMNQVEPGRGHPGRYPQDGRRGVRQLHGPGHQVPQEGDGLGHLERLAQPGGGLLGVGPGPGLALERRPARTRQRQRARTRASSSRAVNGLVR